MASTDMTNNFQQIESALESMRSQIDLLQRAAYDREIRQLIEENAQLKQQVSSWVDKLSALECERGVKQQQQQSLSGAFPAAAAAAAAAPVSSSPTPQPPPSQPLPTLTSTPTPTSAIGSEQSSAAASATRDTGAQSSSKRAKSANKKQHDQKPLAPSAAATAGATPAGAASTGAASTGTGDTLAPDIGRLDLRVGRILSAVKHADADSLYVEQVDVGETEPRTVVSGLVKHVPLDLMQNRLAVLLCNLKPSKMRGVTSQAMVMCASGGDRVEILDPPASAVPGDRVVCAAAADATTPDPQLNPKKKVFEQVAVDLKTDSACRATYRGAVLEVPGKGVVTAPSLADVFIK